MALDIKPINYAEEYHVMKPSLFRESENLDRLLQALFDVCDVQQMGFLWLSENLLNLDVAQGFHLDFIGSIVGQPRFLSDFNTEPYFGFDKSYQSKTFGSALDPEVGGYWNSRSYFNTATSRQLNDEEYRRLIKARAIYNQSNCSSNDLLEVVNLITNSKNNTVQILRHGLIQINTDDGTGILSYFIDRLLNEDNILPIAAGVRVGLEQSASDGLGGGILDTDWIVKKVYEGSIGSKVGVDAVRTKNNLEVKSSIEVTPTVSQISDRIKSREYGAEVNKAVLDIDAKATDWTLDPANNRIKYIVASNSTPNASNSPDFIDFRGVNYYDSDSFCNNVIRFYQSADGTYLGQTISSTASSGKWTCYANGNMVTYDFVRSNPAYDPSAPTTEEKYLPIADVAAKVISNAEAGHAESKSLLVSVVSVLASMKAYDPLF